MGSVEMLIHLTEEEKAKIKFILEDEVTKSGKIRSLYTAGIEVKDIAHLLDVRYNFAYNVVADLIKSGGTRNVSTEETVVAVPTTVEQVEVVEAVEEMKQVPSKIAQVVHKLDEVAELLKGIITPINKSMCL